MGFLGKLKRAARDFIYGMTVGELVQAARKEKLAKNAALMIVAVGDLLGVPIFPPLYRLSLLKFWLPEIEGWKRNLLREKDFLEKAA